MTIRRTIIHTIVELIQLCLPLRRAEQQLEVQAEEAVVVDHGGRVGC